MAEHKTAANVLMLLLLVAGAIMGSRIKQEVFPEFDLDRVLVNVAYPGASPSEVEQGVILAVEEAVRGIDGVKEVRSTANEGTGVIAVELLLGADADRALSDIKAAVDRITSFPEDVERPVVALATNQFRVLDLIIYGDKSERALRELAEKARQELLADERITYADLSSVRQYEISVEVPQENLRRYGLTLEQIAARIRSASIDLPGGSVRSSGGDILVRTTERRLSGSEFEDIVLVSSPSGTQLRVRDVGTVIDGFQDTDQEAYFDGKRAAVVSVFRVGNQTPLTVSAAVKDYLKTASSAAPEGIAYQVWNDSSDIYAQRVDLLVRNARIGLVLVMLVLGLFLEVRLAFWVTMGIPISFIGSLLFIPLTDISINMISLFAFIVTLGMVVDDAIVVGEAAFKRLQDGMSPLDAAIGGVREVATPVTFSILTTCIAFSPLLFVPGMMGKFFFQIPAVVITVLLMSLVESLFILPAHLAHRSRVLAVVARIALLHHFHRLVHPRQQRFSRAVERFVDNVYTPFLRIAVRYRYATCAICVAIFIATIGLSYGGRLQTTFLPKIEGDVVFARVEMPFGTAAEETAAIAERTESALRAVLGSDLQTTTKGIFAQVGFAGMNGGPGGEQGTAGSHLAQIQVYLVPVDERDYSAAQLAERWRAQLGEVAGLESLVFSYSTGPAGSTPIEFELSHPDIDTLKLAGEALAAAIGRYQGTTDIDDGFRDGKPQLDLQLTAAGRSAGLTELELARQLRGAFFGAEAVRQQRGREEVRVYVRRPLEERQSLQVMEDFIVMTPDGGEIPLREAATIRQGRAYTTIERVDGRRVINVGSDVTGTTNANEITAAVLKEDIPALLASVNGLRARPAGEQKQQAEAIGSLMSGAVVAVAAMIGLLIIVFRSWTQWIVVMSAVPFGFVGAAFGHILMGYNISMISIMGIVALAGVVVNDSLILVVAANDFRKEPSKNRDEAVVAAGARRFRPIVLTSLTTFFGLTPMILEQSMQARFLVPMAISLGFGVLFATFIILLMVPALYTIVEDLTQAAWRIVERVYGPMGDDASTRDAPAAQAK